MPSIPPVTPHLPEHALERARALIANGERRLLGIAGAPGSGKSTLAGLLAEALGEQAVVVPMDGFHLAERQLSRLGRQARKGAPDTFDVGGYQALLQRLREPLAGQTIYAPSFERDIEEPIANAIAVPSEARLVISEGNYLLLSEAPWQGVAELFDECWYVGIDHDIRRARLIDRHRRFGRSQAQAEAWVAHTDEPNAQRVERDKERADWLATWDE